MSALASATSAYESSPIALKASPAYETKSPGPPSSRIAGTMVTFDLGLRRSITLESVATFEEIGTLYTQAIEALVTRLQSPVKTWKPLRMTDLSSFHQMRVYKICPDEEWAPALGEIEWERGNPPRRLILFRTKTSSGYILLV